MLWSMLKALSLLDRMVIFFAIVGVIALASQLAIVLVPMIERRMRRQRRPLPRAWFGGAIDPSPYISRR